MATTILPSSPSSVTREYSAVAPLANTPCIISVHAVADLPGRCVAIVEDAFWATRTHDRAYPYAVIVMDGETEVSYDGTDSRKAAETLAWHLSTPLPTIDHDHSDESWWSAWTGGGWVVGAPEPHDLRFLTASAFDHFLDSLAPPDYMDAEQEGGAAW